MVLFHPPLNPHSQFLSWRQRPNIYYSYLGSQPSPPLIWNGPFFLPFTFSSFHPLLLSTSQNVRAVKKRWKASLVLVLNGLRTPFVLPSSSLSLPYFSTAPCNLWHLTYYALIVNWFLTFSPQYIIIVLYDFYCLLHSFVLTINHQLMNTCVYPY